MIKNTNYVELNDTGISNFWPSTSNFVCNINKTVLSGIAESFASEFILPKNVSEVD